MSNITMKERPVNIRPRERSVSVGIENLTDQELIAIILRSGYQNHSVMTVSSTLLGQFKTLKNIRSSRKIVVLGDMLELGDYEIKGHQLIGKSCRP